MEWTDASVTLLSLNHVCKNYGGLPGAARRAARGGAGRAARDYRSKRRGQDHAFSSDQRSGSAVELRNHRLQRPGRHAARTRPDRAPRSGAYVPDQQPVPAADHVRKCAAGVQHQMDQSHHWFKPWWAFDASTSGPKVCSSARRACAVASDELAKNLSYGEQRQLEMAIALAGEPRLLLLDEPTAGMSVAETAHAVETVAALPRDLTMLIIEHDMDTIFAAGGPHHGAGPRAGNRRRRARRGPRRPAGARRLSGRSSDRDARHWTGFTPTTATATSCRASRSRCQAGELVALLGRNGAGKTTTMRSIIGFNRPRAGGSSSTGAT